jgi:hypothetical protein
MVSGRGAVQTGGAMKRAILVYGRREPASLRTAVFALGLLLAGSWALSVAAWAQSGARGQDEKGGRRELSAIVIAAARTGAGGNAQETRTFTLAEGAGRDTRDGHDARGAETMDETDGAGVPPGSARIAPPHLPLFPGIGAAGALSIGDGTEAWPAVAFRQIGRELAPLGFGRGTPGPPAVALSVFMGRKNGDVFSSLHEEYAWRMKFKTMTLGLGFYREIAVGERARILPYVGVIRSSLSLRPAGLASEQLLHEYQLTVLCFGLPLVIGF